MTAQRRRIAPGVRGFGLALALAGAGIALALLLGGPGTQVATLRGLGDMGADPVDGVMAALTLLAQALVCYLLLTVVLATAGRIPGFLGRVFARAFRMVAVPVVRRAVEGALGGALVVGMALGPAAPGALAAEPVRASAAPVVATVSTPVTASATGIPAVAPAVAAGVDGVIAAAGTGQAGAAPESPATTPGGRASPAPAGAAAPAPGGHAEPEARGIDAQLDPATTGASASAVDAGVASAGGAVSARAAGTADTSGTTQVRPAEAATRTETGPPAGDVRDPATGPPARVALHSDGAGAEHRDTGSLTAGSGHTDAGREERPDRRVSTHVVQPGDTLWDIAAANLPRDQRTNGPIAAYWQQIYEANRDTIGANPDRIYPGTTLTLPAPATGR